MPPIATRPATGLSESCIALTEPFEVCVVIDAHSADAVGPKRCSLPSMFGPAVASAVVATLGWASDHTAAPMNTSENAPITPSVSQVSFGRRVNRPIMNTIATGSSKMAIISNRLLSGVGFSSGTALFGPYQPPPLVPSCLIATIAATGPTGIVCSAMPALASIGVACFAPANVLGTPCHVSSSDHTSISGRSTRPIVRVVST